MIMACEAGRNEKKNEKQINMERGWNQIEVDGVGLEMRK